MTEESTLEKIASLAAEEREAVYEEEARKHGLPVAVLKARVSKSWRFIARPKQLPPDGDWMFWFLLCGRGFGKSIAAAQWTKSVALERKCRIGLIAPTLRDVRGTMVEGETGMLSILPTEALLGQSREIAWNKSLLQLTLANGTIIEGFSSDVPDRLRGPQHDYVWAEEVSSWLDASKGAAVGSEMNTTWSNMILGLRLGERPRACLTSTPKANRLTRELVADQQGLVVVSGSSYENQANLSDHWWRNVVEPLRGTRTGRQEIDAELLEDVEGALWTRAMIDEHRVSEAPHLGRIVVAVDPNTTSGEASDDAGIVVAGRGHSDRHGYVLADHTVTRGGPAAWALAAVRAYHEFQADRVVAEANNGGEMVAITIKSVDATVPVKIVHASRGKRTRAEPVASLYTPLEGIRDALVHHVGSAAALSDLEDEMTTWTGDGESPNRMDALVWALTELNLWQPVGRHRSGIAKGGRRVPGVKLGEGLGELAAGAAGGYTSS